MGKTKLSVADLPFFPKKVKTKTRFADLEADVREIFTHVSEFEGIVHTFGGPEATHKICEKLHHKRSHISHLLKSAAAKLHQAYCPEQHSGVSATKRITNDTKDPKEGRKKTRRSQLAKLSKDLVAAERRIVIAQLLADKMVAIANYGPDSPKLLLPESCYDSYSENALPPDFDVDKVKGVALGDPDDYGVFTTDCQSTWVNVNFPLTKIIPGVICGCCLLLMSKLIIGGGKD